MSAEREQQKAGAMVWGVDLSDADAILNAAGARSVEVVGERSQAFIAGYLSQLVADIARGSHGAQEAARKMIVRGGGVL